MLEEKCRIELFVERERERLDSVLVIFLFLVITLFSVTVIVMIRIISLFLDIVFSISFVCMTFLVQRLHKNYRLSLVPFIIADKCISTTLNPVKQYSNQH